jgi:hypothetical protein
MSDLTSEIQIMIYSDQIIIWPMRRGSVNHSCSHIQGHVIATKNRIIRR